MLSILKLVFPAMAASTILFSCTETPGVKNGNDNISAAGIPPLSNELMTARLQMKLKGRYDNVWDYSEGMIAVMKNGKYGFCDTAGNEVIHPLYDGPANFREGVADVKKDGMIGFIDKTGKEIFPFRKYDYAGGFENGLSVFRIIKNEKELYGFIDKAGNEVVPPVYEGVEVSWFGHGNAIVQKGGKWGTITRQNVVVVPFEYDKINDFNNGITTAQKGGKWGIIDSANKVLAPFTMVYKTVYEFSNGYAHVEKNMEHQGFIDINGKEAFGGLKFREAFPFSENGYAIVSEENSTRYMIDKQGAPVLKDATIDDITPIDNNMFVITRNGKQGIVDKENKVLLPIEYTSIMAMGKNLMLVVKDSSRYYADYKGNKVADYTEQ